MVVVKAMAEIKFFLVKLLEPFIIEEFLEMALTFIINLSIIFRWLNLTIELTMAAIEVVALALALSF